jgi:hypothetical protein
MGPMSDVTKLWMLCVADFGHAMPSSWLCCWPKVWQISASAKPKLRLGGWVELEAITEVMDVFWPDRGEWCIDIFFDFLFVFTLLYLSLRLLMLAVAPFTPDSLSFSFLNFETALLKWWTSSICSFFSVQQYGNQNKKQ